MGNKLKKRQDKSRFLIRDGTLIKRERDGTRTKLVKLDGELDNVIEKMKKKGVPIEKRKVIGGKNTRRKTII